MRKLKYNNSTPRGIANHIANFQYNWTAKEVSVTLIFPRILSR